MAVRQLSNGNSDGTVLGQSATDLIGFHGVAPVAQAALTTAPAATGSTNSSPYGFVGATQADAIVTWIRAVDAALKAKGIISST
jgi:hypothetical protein